MVPVVCDDYSAAQQGRILAPGGPVDPAVSGRHDEPVRTVSGGGSSAGKSVRDEIQRSLELAGRDDVVLQMTVNPPEVRAGKTPILLDDPPDRERLIVHHPRICRLAVLPTAARAPSRSPSASAVSPSDASCLATLA